MKKKILRTIIDLIGFIINKIDKSSMISADIYLKLHAWFLLLILKLDFLEDE